MSLLRSLARRIEECDLEERNLARFLSRLGPPGSLRVLEVGCGYGRNLGPLGARGYDVVGVDVNPGIVASNVREGRRCLTPEQFDATGDSFDVLLLAHVIEHFAPAELLRFMDHYLERLKPGGHLIIATPLLTQYFYDDFDHVRPYTPAGITMVFGGGSDQVQFYGKARIELVDLWYRRAPLRVVHHRGRSLGGDYHLRLLNLALALLFRLTGRLAGTTDGWMGLYRKCP